MRSLQAPYPGLQPRSYIATIHPYLEKSLHASGEIAPEQYHRLLPIIHVGRSETTDSHEAEALAAKVLACRMSREIEALLAYERPGMELKKWVGPRCPTPCSLPGTA